MKKSFKEVAKDVDKELENIRQSVTNMDSVASYLRALADQASIDPNTHSEIVKSATLLRLFLENQAAGARKQFATAFEGPVDAVS